MKKIPNVIQQLIDRLEIVEAVEPKDKVPEGATVVGVMPEELRRLAALRGILCDEHNEIAERGQEELRAIDSRAEQKKAMRRIKYELHIADKKYAAIDELFWIGVRTTFPELNGKSSVSFGEGWQVYWEEEKEETPCQCEICTAMREAGLRIPGIGVEIIEIPIGGGLLGGLSGLFSRLGRGPKPDESDEKQETSETGEPQAASQPSTESDQG